MNKGTLSPTEFSSAVTAITAAFGDPTRREIYLFVHQQTNGVTAGEVAERFGLHPNVARHHLDKLTGGGHLEVHVGKGATASGAGRPSKRYFSHSEDVELDLPVRHDDVLRTLLGKALELLAPEQAEKMAEEVGMEYGKTMAAAMGDAADIHLSFRTALQAVADALSAHGFAAHTEQSDTGLRIVSDHCPFGTTPIDHPVICAVDRGMMRGMLSALHGEVVAVPESSRPDGDNFCSTAIAEG